MTNRKGWIVATAVVALAAVAIFGLGLRRRAAEPTTSPAQRLAALRLRHLSDIPPERLAPSDPRRYDLECAAMPERRPARPAPPDAAMPPIPAEVRERISFQADADVLQEKGGVYLYNSPTYAATLDRGTIEFGLPGFIEGIGRPVVSFTLTQVRVGETSLDLGAAPAPRTDSDHRDISYERGAVREQYSLRPGGMEQSFVISKLPERGAITVRGLVDSNLAPPADGPAATLAFRHAGQDVVGISDAVAVDAAGRRLPLELNWASGTLSMTVPADWVASASLPITIDPLLTGAMSIPSTVSVDNAGQSNFHMTYNSSINMWVCIYTVMVGTSDYDVNLCQIYPDGVLSNPFNYPLISGPTQDAAGDICYAPQVDRTMVVWTSRATAGAERKLWGRVMDSQRNWTSSAVIIADYTYEEEMPAVAWDGANWYVVFRNGGPIRGRFVSPAGVPGTVADPEPTANSYYPKVTYGNGVYLVYWYPNNVPGSVFMAARTLNPAGVFQTPMTVLSDPGDQTAYYHAAAGPGTFLAVWLHYGGIKCRQFTPTLTPVGNSAAIFPREYTPPAVENTDMNPKVIYSAANAEWYVVYHENVVVPSGQYSYNWSSTPIMGRHIGLNGSISSPEMLTSGLPLGDRPADFCLNTQTNKPLLVTANNGSNWARRIDLSYPSVPSNFRAIPGNGQVELVWSPMQDASSYALYRSTDPAGPYKSVMSGISGTTYVDAGLTNNLAYYYQLTAFLTPKETVALINLQSTTSFRETPPAELSVTPSNAVLFVVATAPATGADLTIQTRLQNAGYTVTTMPATATAANAAGKILVVVSSTVTSATVNTKFRTLALPVVAWENALFDDLGMTGTVANTDYGSTTGQTTVTISAAGHPLAAGLTGSPTVVTAANTHSWGLPNANAVKAATLAGNSALAVVFGYDTGAAMPGLIAPARRVGLFLADATATTLNANGWALFDAAIAWSTHTGAGSLPPPTPSPTIMIDGRGAYPSLYDAATSAQSGDLILLGAGTFSIPGGVTLRGGVSLRGAAPHQTIVDGLGAATTLRLAGTATNGVSIIDSLTITGGAEGLNVGNAQVFLRNLQIVGQTGNGLVCGAESAVEGVSLTIADNSGTGIVLANAQAQFRNVILGRNLSTGIQGPAGARITYSTVFGSAFPATGGISLTGTGMLTSTITFVNPAAKDYREASGSASINAGDPADGYRAEPGTNGSRINQGAFGNTAFAVP